MSDEAGGAGERVDGAAGEPRRTNEPMVLALIGLGVAALLFAASALPVILSRGDDDAGTSVTMAPVVTDTATPSSEPVTSATVDPTVEPVSTESSAAPASTDASAGASTTTVGTAPATTAPATTAEEEVPESVAVVLGGRIYLEGAVPDEESRAEIVALATEIFTSDNVIDNYFVDPRASDPNLGNIRVDDTVLFATDSARISPEFEPLLNQGLALLTIRPSATFVIEGHTDSRGGDEYNLRLSQDRADAIVRWYTDRGIDGSRLTAIGRGETELIASDDTPEGRETNRRIEVTIENLLVDS